MSLNVSSQKYTVYCPLVVQPTHIIFQLTLLKTFYLLTAFATFFHGSCKDKYSQAFSYKAHSIKTFQCTDLSSVENSRGQMHLKEQIQSSLSYFHNPIVLYIKKKILYYLIFFPQHGELAVIDGWFYHLHFQVINSEIEIPEPEDHTVMQSMIIPHYIREI